LSKEFSSSDEVILTHQSSTIDMGHVSVNQEGKLFRDHPNFLNTLLLTPPF
jgi:hypothetical protein